MKTKNLVTIREYAELMKVSNCRVRQFISSGRIKTAGHNPIKIDVNKYPKLPIKVFQVIQDTGEGVKQANELLKKEFEDNN